MYFKILESLSRKIILDYTPEYDYLLYALISFEKDYKLIWDINNSLGMDFIRTEDFSSFNRKINSEQLFSCFEYRDENSYLKYRVISNKSENGPLLDELKRIDYLVMITGDFQEDFSSDFLTILKKIKSIQNVFSIDPQNLKSRDRLVLD